VKAFFPTMSTRLRKGLTCAVTALALVITFSAESQSTMSLEDTLKWMKNYLDAHGMTSPRAQKSKDRKQSFTGRNDFCGVIKTSNGCSVTGHYGCSGYPAEFQKDFTLDLKNFDPASVKATTYFDNTWSGDLGNAVVIQTSDAAGMQYFPIDSAESAAHFAKALSHAVQLCGGISAF
jgi:hypothetical protein